MFGGTRAEGAGTQRPSISGDLASLGAIALSIEVPFIFDRPDPLSALCSRGFFQGAIVCRGGPQSSIGG
jgi:hypothetical protein